MSVSNHEYFIKINVMLYFQVQETHSGINRIYKVVGVAQVGADQQTLTYENKECTIQQYFAKRYYKSLHFPKLNLLQVGVEEKKVFLPIEVK